MRYLFILGFAILISACSSTPSATESTGDQLSTLFEGYEAFTYYTYPEYATYNGIHDYDDRLNDQSAEAGQKYIDSIIGFKKALLAMDPETLSENNQLNYDLFMYTLDDITNEYGYEISHYLGFNQQNGYHITFPQITQVQPLNTENDVKNYFLRLRNFPIQVDHLIRNLKDGKTKGILLPCDVSEQVLNQLEGFARMDIESSPLYQVKDKSEVLAKEADELADLIANEVTPAYQRLYQYFKDDYHPSCRKTAGVSYLSGGLAYYDHLIKKHTTTDLSADEIFDLGTEEVERIRAEMISTKAELGYQDMELTEFFTHLRTSPAYYFDDKQDLLDGYRVILDGVDARLPDFFGKLPKATYDLKELEAYRAEAAPTAYYYPVPDDGSRPGYFYVNTYQLNSRPKYTMTALAMHEAVPGHHLQIALATELDNVPWFRNQMFVTAYTEGWGLYAEYLGYEMGMYADPLQKMGALSFEMWRACRLVVDVGIHAKGWNKEQAVEFLRGNVPLSELDINSEVDRYISWPGQALGYKIGELKIKSLRDRAAEKFQDDFDLKEFHDVILENGAIPLGLLEENINAWIESKKSS